MKAEVVDFQNKKIDEVELSDKVFKIEPSKSSVYEAVKNELANRRQGTASAKTKAEVAGSGTKPFRQKGTGRARVGTKKNPVWRGGGVVFGPKPRDYSYKIPKKMKKLAYRSIFSLKLKDGTLKIIDDLKIKDGKTKEVVAVLKPLFNEAKTSLILDNNENALLVKRAARNIPWVRCLSYNRMNAHALYYSKNIAITKSAALELNKFLEDSDVEGAKK